MLIGVPRETVPGERRVAVVPESVARLIKAGLEVAVQPGAGQAASFPDESYAEKGAKLEPEVLGRADIVLKVQPPTPQEIAQMREGAALISYLQPYTNAEGIQALAARKVTAFSLELVPRITRAQPMDVLSAMSTIAGYKAVLIAAHHLPKFVPLLMTAAGTITPAKFFVIGAGVAGLQAIGVARRMGAVVEAYDMRPVVKEQVESLGAKFVELGLETQDAQDKSGYARAQSEEFYRKQAEMMRQYVTAADAVITTALVPGKRAPVLITEEMVRGMRPGSVIVDLAAEAGGNCALTEPGKEVVKFGVTIVGLTNLPSTMPYHASTMYSRNITAFLFNLWKDGQLHIDLNDEIVRGTLVTQNGEIVHEVAKATVASKVSA